MSPHGVDLERQYLEFWQRSCGVERFDYASADFRTMFERANQGNLDSPDYGEHEALADQAKSQQTMRRVIAECPEFEDPISWYLLDDLGRRLHVAAKEGGVPVPEDVPLFGTIPTGQINAMTIRVPGGRRGLVVFERELFMFCLLFSKIVAQITPPRFIDFDEFGDFDVKYVELDADLVSDRLFDAVSAYVVDGSLYGAEQYYLRWYQHELHMRLLDGMELFVLGHEYGHLLQGHLEKSDVIQMALPGDVEGGVVTPSWQEEFEADEMGLYLSLLTTGSGWLPGFLGADVFFSLIRLVQDSVEILATGANPKSLSDTHPPPELRQERLRAFLREQIAGEDDASSADFGIEVAETVSGMLKVFSRSLNENMLRLHADGVRPAEPWLHKVRSS